MNFKLKKSKFFFRKLKISDFKKFNKLFYSCFEKKISYDFFKWRYFNDDSSFCYGVFIENNLIANVGMKSLTLNNKKNEKIFSRHSSMVLEKYRGKGIFSKLSKEVKKKILKQVNTIIMWPNKKNFSNFDLPINQIIKKKLYIYKTNNSKKEVKKTANFNIKKIEQFKHLIKVKDEFLLKNYDYFKNRYLSYKNNDYLLNKFQLNNNTSFFILKKNYEKYKKINYVVVDHFGSSLIKSQHLKKITNEERSVIFLSKKKINKKNHVFVNYLNLNIGLFKKNDVKKKINFFHNKKFMLGDTDTFITIK